MIDDKAIEVCKSKNRYADIFTAIAMGVTRSEDEGIPLYTYRCEVCSGWHLTKDRRPMNGNLKTRCDLSVY